MNYIATTFAYGNGPYSRCVEWAIALNDVREERGFTRLPVVVPLVYPDRQEKILKEEIETNVSSDFIDKHPEEILFDRKYGELLNNLMFKGKNYAENLEVLIGNYYGTEKKIMKHLNGRREVKKFDDTKLQVDLRDCELQLGLNNRIQTGLFNQFYTAGGAGPFDEILKRAIEDKEIIIDKDLMKKVLPIAERMIQNQRIIFSNEPGVFSYDSFRKLRENEILGPPFVHPPKFNYVKLPEEGIYFLASGIDGIRESGIYDAINELGMRVYTAEFSLEALPKEIKEQARGYPVKPGQIKNPKILAKFARAGWSEVWLSHLAEKGFLTPKYNKQDDPEMLFNERGIEKLGIGAVINGDPKESLKKAISLSESAGNFNNSLLLKYGTLDGIRYSAEMVADKMKYYKSNP